MRAKIEVSHDGGATVFASFQYRGFSGSRVISRVIRQKINHVTDETMFRVIQRFNRVCIWCQIEQESNTPERIESDDELGRLYYSDVLDVHGNRTA